jgi:hypothetical protein
LLIAGPACHLLELCVALLVLATLCAALHPTSQKIIQDRSPVCAALNDLLKSSPEIEIFQAQYVRRWRFVY